MDWIRNRWKSLPLSINVTVLEGIFDLWPTCGILSVRCWNLCGFNQYYLLLLHICNLQNSCGPAHDGVWLFLWGRGSFSSLLVMTGACRWKAVLCQGKFCQLTGLVRTFFFFWLEAWYAGQGAVRVFGSKTASSQGVFPSLVQDHASGTQQCHTVQNCHVKGLVNYAQQSILCGNEAFPGLASLLPFPFINPKGVRDCWGEEFYIWQNHQIFFFRFWKKWF